MSRDQGVRLPFLKYAARKKRRKEERGRRRRKTWKKNNGCCQEFETEAIGRGRQLRSNSEASRE